MASAPDQTVPSNGATSTEKSIEHSAIDLMEILLSKDSVGVSCYAYSHATCMNIE